MNDALRRALFTARLTEEDIAAHLEVDPKTVRRWLTGRFPYARHRQSLAHLLNVEESVLWPRLKHVRELDSELVAVYPHGLEPSAWLAFLTSATSNIDILHQHDPGTTAPDLAAIENRFSADVPTRLILTLATIRSLAPRPKRHIHSVKKDFSHDLYRADNELLIRQRTFGQVGSADPIVHVVDMGHPSGLFATYTGAFEAVWQI